MKELLNKEYGAVVEIEYIDVQDAERINHMPEVRSVLECTRLSDLPIVLINGNVVWYGSVSYQQLVPEINKRSMVS